MKYWVAVASADHVAIGRAQGFMQVCHGKVAPLRRLSEGDGVVYYSPAQQFQQANMSKLQAFTALGRIAAGAPYQADMGGGFHPYRRDVHWLPSEFAAITPLLSQLSFTQGRKQWGYLFRFGLFEILEADFDLIANAMKAEQPLVLSNPVSQQLGFSYD